MFIPKNKMPMLVKVIDLALEIDEYDPPVDFEISEEDKEILRNIHDRITLCQHGDAPFLEIEVCYSNNPSRGPVDNPWWTGERRI